MVAGYYPQGHMLKIFDYKGAYVITGNVDEEQYFHNLAFDDYKVESSVLTFYRDNEPVGTITGEEHVKAISSDIESLRKQVNGDG